MLYRRNAELQRRLVTGQSGDVHVRLEVNMCVFGCFLKVLQCRTSGGKLFHILRAEYENARLLRCALIVRHAIFYCKQIAVNGVVPLVSFIINYCDRCKATKF